MLRAIWLPRFQRLFNRRPTSVRPAATSDASRRKLLLLLTLLRGHSLGQNYIIDEFIVRFTHTVRMDWLAPGIEPTGWVPAL